MQFEQSLMIAGASIAGICFAMAGAQPEKKYLYYVIGGMGVALIAFTYLKAVI